MLQECEGGESTILAPPDFCTSNEFREAVITTIAPNGGVPLPFVIPSTSTCLRQVEGENDQAKLGWPIQAFFWLEWGCCGPSHPFRVIRSEAEESAGSAPSIKCLRGNRFVHREQPDSSRRVMA